MAVLKTTVSNYQMRLILEFSHRMRGTSLQRDVAVCAVVYSDSNCAGRGVGDSVLFFFFFDWKRNASVLLSYADSSRLEPSSPKLLADLIRSTRPHTPRPKPN
jgi:hypothetical protein